MNGVYKLVFERFHQFRVTRKGEQRMCGRRRKIYGGNLWLVVFVITGNCYERIRRKNNPICAFYPDANGHGFSPAFFAMPW
jgi:hypothetical protein